jgi:hypothetical protein
MQLREKTNRRIGRRGRKSRMLMSFSVTLKKTSDTKINSVCSETVTKEKVNSENKTNIVILTNCE